MSTSLRPHRILDPLGRTPPDRRAAAVRRDLAQVTHIPGDLSSDEIERRYQAALREIRWRHHAPDDTA